MDGVSESGRWRVTKREKERDREGGGDTNRVKKSRKDEESKRKSAQANYHKNDGQARTAHIMPLMDLNI